MRGTKTPAAWLLGLLLAGPGSAEVLWDVDFDAFPVGAPPPTTGPPDAPTRLRGVPGVTYTVVAESGDLVQQPLEVVVTGEGGTLARVSFSLTQAGGSEARITSGTVRVEFDMLVGACTEGGDPPRCFGAAILKDGAAQDLQIEYREPAPGSSEGVLSLRGADVQFSPRPYTLGVAQHFEVEVELGPACGYTVRVDGAPFGTAAIGGGFGCDFANFDGVAFLGSGSGSAGSLAVDDLRIETLPEPSRPKQLTSVGLLLLGLARLRRCSLS